ncbi:Protein-tyrosine phosphatase [Dictyocaulus viviparus]|uniref:Protein-tyrosine phosphatase n=1 Tax=Dictyocaulus viviparus TaxID=29172 RepID=A0A0D8YBN9_DICVI|nr:Protein-tyrosine phosphatase [Dictyocaulus viviparus]
MELFIAGGRIEANLDVGCLDFQRVVLNIGPVSYIHANYVSTPVSPKRFICTQAPLAKTCAEFWYMVVQENSDAIIMLCNFVEQGSKKSADYVPLTPDTSPKTFEGVTVTLKKQEQFQFPIQTKVNVVVSSLEVKVPNSPVHKCSHYHWRDWPDRGVPETDLAPVYLLTKIQSTTTPIIIHCSAGIGRTGSIVLIQHALELLNSQQPLGEIRGLLLALRKQRNNSIQTEHQYLYIHQVLLLYLKKMKYLDETAVPYLEKFTTDYVAATRGF